MSYLQHYGVLGMKWGVRRYQNKDGTLTAAGKKHLKEKAGWYMNAPYDPSGKTTYHRTKIGDEYSRKYWEINEKYNPGDDSGDLDSLIDEEHGRPFTKLWNSYSLDYVEATLKDLGYSGDRDNKTEAYEFVKKLFDKELLYEYDVYDRSNNNYIGKDVWNLDIKELKDMNPSFRYKNPVLVIDGYKSVIPKTRSSTNNRKPKASFQKGKRYKEYLKERGKFYEEHFHLGRMDESHLEKNADADWDVYVDWLISKGYDIPED